MLLSLLKSAGHRDSLGIIKMFVDKMQEIRCAHMERFLGVVVLGAGVALAQLLEMLRAAAGPGSALENWTLHRTRFFRVAAAAAGESTVMGGEIRSVDPVQDQFQLKVFGQRPMKILFDARTQVYRDGKKIPLRDLGSEEHASVQTVLDGAKCICDQHSCLLASA